MLASSSYARLANKSSGPVRLISTSSVALRGGFLRPREAPSNDRVPASSPRERRPAVAEPHTPPHIIPDQAPNYPHTWSRGQNPRENAMKGPRFEQTKMEFQPQPLSAMEMIHREPIRLVEQRVVSCDGGELQNLHLVVV